MAALLLGRIVTSAATERHGWVARYFANDNWSGAPEWSSDFRMPDATRIDDRIAFKDDALPAHYLNDPAFNRGIRREVSEPMSVDWRAHAFVAADRTLPIALRARGGAAVSVDDRIVLTVSSLRDAAAATTSVHLAPGAHTLAVRYVKAADIDPLIDVDVPIKVTIAATAHESRALQLLTVARTIDAGLLIVFACAALHAIRRHWQPWHAVPLALFAGFGLQGWWRARHLIGHVVSLTSGDDWFGFESSAREILRHGPLMTLGRPLGEGAPYFYHPLYCYFLAVVHAITGESLFGPVFVQFLMLAAVATLLWRFAGEIFGASPALVGLGALVVILELDFARYYTVTLLSENLYILTVTLTLLPFARWIARGERRDLWQASLWGGVSSITRPSMMLFFVPALALVAFIAAQRGRSIRASLAPVVATAAIWLAVIAPITLRNLVVSHRFVLISEGLGAGFITYNMPPSADPAAYAGQYTGSVLSGLTVLARIAWDHPADMLKTQGRKLGFSLGMVQWYGGYRPHPELVAVTLLYISTIIASKAMRARMLWPVHLFVVAHVASMSLTMPWNYGYRLIIPPFAYTSALSAAAACSLVAMRLPAFHAQRTSRSRV
jgi:hypothetical protein